MIGHTNYLNMLSLYKLQQLEHSSKFLLLSSTVEENRMGLEQHEKCKWWQNLYFGVYYPFKETYIANWSVINHRAKSFITNITNFLALYIGLQNWTKREGTRWSGAQWEGKRTIWERERNRGDNLCVRGCAV